MNDKVVLILTNIIKQYGTNICNDPKKLKGILSDLCNDCKKEINVLIMALQQNIVVSILNISDVEIDNITYKRLVEKLCNESGLAVESSNWAIETWCKALGKKVDGIESYNNPNATNQKAKENESINNYNNISDVNKNTVNKVQNNFTLKQITSDNKSFDIRNLLKNAIFLLIITIIMGYVQVNLLRCLFYSVLTPYTIIITITWFLFGFYNGKRRVKHYKFQMSILCFLQFVIISYCMISLYDIHIYYFGLSDIIDPNYIVIRNFADVLVKNNSQFILDSQPFLSALFTFILTLTGYLIGSKK